MVGVQNEDAVHRAGENRVHLVVLGRHREAHAQEVRGVVEFVARRHEGLAGVILERAGCDRRHLRDHAMLGNLALHRIIHVRAVVIESRKRADSAAHDGHRVRIAAEAFEEAVELRVQHGVPRDRVGELGILIRLGQLAVQEQVADFQEARLLGELLDRVATVEQDAGVTIDVGDLAFAAGGRGEARVQREHARLGVHLADVDHIGTDRAAVDGQFDRLAIGMDGRLAVRFHLVLHRCSLLNSIGLQPVSRRCGHNRSCARKLHYGLARRAQEQYRGRVPRR